MTYETIGYCDHKKKGIAVLRDNHGKFYVIVDEIQTQKRLTAKEIVRYLLNAMNEKEALTTKTD